MSVCTKSPERLQFLHDEEIQEFVKEINPDGNETLSYIDVERTFQEAHQNLIGSSIPEQRYDIQWRCFMQSTLGPYRERISRDEMTSLVRGWHIPSLRVIQQREEEHKGYLHRLPNWRKMRAFWAVRGPEIVFMSFVAVLQVSFAVWMILRYKDKKYTAAFGWGLAIAKGCAGALYPTFFFLLLSVSRYFSTLLRRSYYTSRFFNVDLSRAFHVRMACVTLILATTHGIAHLAGTFAQASENSHRGSVVDAIGTRFGSYGYLDYMRSIPAVTGIVTLGLLLVLAILSTPRIRRWSYELFQFGHLLKYPIIGLMMAHGTASLFQPPVFGYVLAVPTFMILFERLTRFCLSFYRVKAILRVVDNDTVQITAVIPRNRPWDYTAGQYVFLKIPAISSFQWHPFTISFCHGKEMTLHIKTDGNWTHQLRDLGGRGTDMTEIEVRINGPFGAPAQRFHNFDHSIVIGTGIGITPFSAIVANLQHDYDLKHGDSSHWGLSITSDSPRSSPADNACSSDREEACRKYRRTDFHWIVRDACTFVWLSDLLNKVFVSQAQHRRRDHTNLDIRINTYVTNRPRSIAAYIFSWLIETRRVDGNSVSPLTGLMNTTNFGRPNLDNILDEHYTSVVQKSHMNSKAIAKSDSMRSGSEGGKGHIRVGVFFCGGPGMGKVLADKCRQLTLQSFEDRTNIEYHLMLEVFG